MYTLLKTKNLALFPNGYNQLCLSATIYTRKQVLTKDGKSPIIERPKKHQPDTGCKLLGQSRYI